MFVSRCTHVDSQQSPPSNEQAKLFEIVSQIEFEAKLKAKGGQPTGTKLPSDQL